MVTALQFNDNAMQLGMHFGVLSIFIGTLAANGAADAQRAMEALVGIAAEFNVTVTTPKSVLPAPEKRRGRPPKNPVNVTLCPTAEAAGLGPMG